MEGIRCVFITDHNNLRGVKALFQLKENHEKFRETLIIPAMELSTQDGHVIALGVKNHIKTGLPFEDSVDLIRKENGIPVPVHPFSLEKGVREKASMCDVIEVHNATNVDIFSNIAAENYAQVQRLTPVAGSDAHIPQLVGRCSNEIEADLAEDDILSAIERGRIKPKRKGYIAESEMLMWVYSRLQRSRRYILAYLKTHKPRSYRLGDVGLGFFLNFPSFPLWRFMLRMSVREAKKLSRKANTAWL